MVEPFGVHPEVGSGQGFAPIMNFLIDEVVTKGGVFFRNNAEEFFTNSFWQVDVRNPCGYAELGFCAFECFSLQKAVDKICKIIHNVFSFACQATPTGVIFCFAGDVVMSTMSAAYFYASDLHRSPPKRRALRQAMRLGRLAYFQPFDKQ